jgi:hypothetical protein
VIYKLFSKYEEKFGSARLRGGLHSLQVTHVKGSMHGEGFLEVLEPLVLLDLHLPLLPIHPYQHLLLLVS